jgi:general secretion pathway protein K
VKDKKETDIDSLQDIWDDPDKIDRLLADFPFDKGTLKLNISDELGKIQVNALVIFPQGRDFNESQRNLWDRFLRLPTVIDSSFKDAVDPTMVINAMKDWLDSGDDDAITGLSGAESDYYKSLDPPYPCRNGPFTHLSELGLVRGLTPPVLEEIENKTGMLQYISIHGMADTDSLTYKGRININTAAVPVIEALLPAGNEALARAIADYRLEMSDSTYIHDLSKPTWYKDVPGCSHLVIDTDLLTTSSDVFHIEATAGFETMQIRATGIVLREKNKKTGAWGCRLLRWEFE